MILEALFVNHCVLMAHKESHIQLIMDKLVEATHLFGLKISLGKTEVLLKPGPGSIAPTPPISIEGTTMKSVEELKYLGSIITSKVKMC